LHTLLSPARKNQMSHNYIVRCATRDYNKEFYLPGVTSECSSLFVIHISFYKYVIIYIIIYNNLYKTLKI